MRSSVSAVAMLYFPDMDTPGFYDALAEGYHLLFID